MEISSPEPGSVVGTATVMVTGQAAPGNTVIATTQVAQAEARIRVAEPLAAAAPSTEYTGVADPEGRWSIPVGPLADGAHTVSVVQRSATGGASNPTSFTVFIDTVALAPDFDLETDPDERLLPAASGAAEPGATVEILNGAGQTVDQTVADMRGNWSISQVDGLDFGSQTVAARQVDVLGNQSAETAATRLNLRHISIAALLAVGPVGGNPAAIVLGEPDASFDVLLNGVWLNQFALGRLGIWAQTMSERDPDPTVPLLPLAPGEHSLAVRYGMSLDDAASADEATRFGPEHVIRFTLE